MQLRMTNQREIILRVLRSNKQHLTADELYDVVKKLMPRISLATVYRNLEILSDAGMIGKLEISGRQKRFDYDPSDHHHIYCAVCHRVDNLPDNCQGVKQKDLGRVRGYSVTGYRLEIVGICPDCQALEEKEKKGDE
ncbi:Fur family transcriptional regulator [Desulforhopalus singaporensis]|uniref:Fur family transcriptional regulator, ferric uptake regulator n=1 Tax=Desulforhopalus singaporensis TaxID=91360 RepID=A0A1H0TYF6_9BACT|nr:transcriptional repressor [Desulforhopalus singaporensis]SDP58979.1 Fur family transcriptional regulator, ferric uptake regulator [Desulforhopalus singaporensis]